MVEPLFNQETRKVEPKLSPVLRPDAEVKYAGCGFNEDVAFLTGLGHVAGGCSRTLLLVEGQ